MPAELTHPFTDMEVYRGFCIQGRAEEDGSDWRAELRIGHDERNGFVEVLPRVTRQIFRMEGLLNLLMVMAPEARAAIDHYIAESSQPGLR